MTYDVSCFILTGRHSTFFYMELVLRKGRKMCMDRGCLQNGELAHSQYHKRKCLFFCVHPQWRVIGYFQVPKTKQKQTKKLIINRTVHFLEPMNYVWLSFLPSAHSIKWKCMWQIPILVRTVQYLLKKKKKEEKF